VVLLPLDQPKGWLATPIKIEAQGVKNKKKSQTIGTNTLFNPIKFTRGMRKEDIICVNPNKLIKSLIFFFWMNKSEMPVWREHFRENVSGIFNMIKIIFQSQKL
jgi:hypothetical protein